MSIIDDFVQSELRRQQIPGGAVGIFRNGQPLYLQGFGLANVEHEVPVQSETLFQAGSIGKMFTAMAVMVLVEDGELELDASVRRYLPDAPEAWQAITLRHLLNHTSGLGDAYLDTQREYADEVYLQAYYAAAAVFLPGRRWAYSNTGYSVLGFVMNKVAGRHYSEVLRERIFEPANMRSARLLSDRDIVMHRAAGYERVGNRLLNQQWASASTNALAEGSLYLSLMDYARWDAVVAARGLLTAKSWEQILRPAPLNDGTSYPYGFGWEIERTPHGQRVVGHDGAWQGFRTEMRRYEDDGVTFVVLANADNADVGHILRGVAERHDPRYQQVQDSSMSDQQPELTQRLRDALDRIEQGDFRLVDFPDMDPVGDANSPEEAIGALKAAGTRTRLNLVRHQPNGDRLDRVYRAECADAALTIYAVFEVGDRRLLSVFVHQDDFRG